MNWQKTVIRDMDYGLDPTSDDDQEEEEGKGNMERCGWNCAQFFALDRSEIMRMCIAGRGGYRKWVSMTTKMKRTWRVM